jgi:hypothetical protein
MDAKNLRMPCDTPTALSSSRRGPGGSLVGRAVIVLSLAAVWGCTVTSTTNPDGGGVTPVGHLGFTPSNGIAAAIADVDTSMLVDIDVKNADDQLHVDCASMANGGCFEKTVVQSDGSSVELYFAKSWKIEPAGVLNVNDATPVVVVALETIDVLGLISLHASGFGTVAGGFTGTTDGAAGGPGKGVPGRSDMQGVDTGIAGGGGSFCGAGGAGGKATATNGGAGATYGTPSLVPLVGGSAGGPGSLFPGAGGGAIQLVAGTSLDVGSTGSIWAGGGAGADGTDDGNYVSNGGGSGGAVLIESPTVTVAGTIAVNGGGGGGGGGGETDALDGANSATAATGGRPGTTGAGGNGSAGATVTGAAGGLGDALGGDYSPGAGGGGAGYIRINTSSGVATLTGTLSPAAGSACVSQGAIAH